ncbi:hypothetical protein ACIQAR_22595 [Micromonospora chalcea]
MARAVMRLIFWVFVLGAVIIRSFERRQGSRPGAAGLRSPHLRGKGGGQAPLIRDTSGEVRQMPLAVSTSTSDPSPLRLSESWSTPLWEPFKIAIAATYSLCLQRCYETSISILHATPLRVTSFKGLSAFEGVHLVLLFQAVGYITWLSLNFIHNMGLYLFVPAEPIRRRLLVHGHLTASLTLFYLFGATVGKPTHNQLLLILGLLFLDLLFPLFLKGVLPNRVRWLWFLRGWAQLAGVFWIGWRFKEDQLMNPLFSLLFMALMLIQAVVFTPGDIKRMKHRLGSVDHRPSLPQLPNG